MKKSLIILVALIVLFEMPVMAKPMVMVTNPIFEENNLPALNECEEQELSKVEEDVEPNGTSISNTTVIYIPQTNTSINLQNGTSVYHGTNEINGNATGTTPNEPSTPNPLTVALGAWGNGIGIDIAKMLME